MQRLALSPRSQKALGLFLEAGLSNNVSKLSVGVNVSVLDGFLVVDFDNVMPASSTVWISLGAVKEHSQ